MITLLNGAIGPDDFMNDIFLSEKRQKLTNLAKTLLFKGFNQSSLFYPKSYPQFLWIKKIESLIIFIS